LSSQGPILLNLFSAEKFPDKFLWKKILDKFIWKKFWTNLYEKKFGLIFIKK
jgi:hypothetical protein